MGPVAVVGIDCRFPGAPDTAGFWEMLMRSGDGVGRVPPQRWAAADFHSADGAEGRTNTTEGGFIADPDVFDNEFFTVSPREAAAMDPQQRLLLHSAWRAVEDSGVAPHRLKGSGTGVFVGIMSNEWAQLHLTDYPRVTAQVGSGNGYCMTANRISYHLDLKGPSLAVDTACSSSLVATHLAVNALLAGECGQAIVGGVNLALTPALSIFYTQAGLSAPDGRCKPFSSQADGIGRGEGVGTVVLRRLEDALADGQRVYAVIRGTAVNQDGRSNGITAPNRWSQQEVVAAAYRRAGVEPSDVAFTEGHGTGTALGDMMEVKALGHHHAGRTGRPMALGSVKGNLGHTEGAAGVAGLIKVALALHHRTVPASRFAAKESAVLRLREQGLRLLKAPLRLPAGTTVAGLSSFGMGGTNAHAVLESAPPAASRAPAAAGKDTGGAGAGVFTLTAPTPEALRRNLRVQADAVTARRVPLGALCWTSNHVKQGHRHRFAVAACDTRELSGLLRSAADDEEVLKRHAGTAAGQRLAFLFTGQGSQYAGMTAGLYRDSPLYRRFLDEAEAALLPHTHMPVREAMFGTGEEIHRTEWTQPALFAAGYALGATLQALGARPELVLGHSVGEFAAACLSGALPLEGAARLVAARGRLMQRLPAGGGMLAVRASRESLEERVADEPWVSIAVVNGPEAVVLSGDVPALEQIEKELGAENVRTRRLTVSHAFHSPLMQPMVEEFAEVAREVGGAAPRVPFYSTVLGRRLRDGEALDAGYWTSHIAAPVAYADAAAALLADGPTHLVEAGPQPTLTSLARRLGPRAPESGGFPAVAAPVKGADSGGRELAAVLAALYKDGLEPDWDAVYEPGERHQQRLAPYEFSAEHRYWTAAPVRAPASGPGPDGEPGVAPGQAALPVPGTRAEEASAQGVLPPEQAPAADGGDPVAGAVLRAVGQVGGYPLAELGPHQLLYEDLGFDSVMVMELKHRIEEELTDGDELDMQELLPRLSSVGDLIGFLREHPATATATAAGTSTGPATGPGPGIEERTA